MTDYTGTYFTCAAVPGWLSKGVDANGVRWKMTSLTGWDEPPDARTNFTPRTEADGSHDAPVYDGDRLISWTGLYVAPDRATREATKTTLAQLARALKVGVDLVGHDETGDKTVHAKRSGGWKGAPFGPLGWQYQASAVCPDPFKYGPPSSVTTALPAPGSGGLAFPLFDVTGMLEFGSAGVTGQIQLPNPGTENAWPTFTITGPVLGGVVLTDMASGRSIVYADDVPAGGVLLVIDSSVGRASLNGADRTGSLTTKQWTPVPPGSSSTWQFSTLGASGQSGTCTGTVYPTYQ